MIVQCQDCKIAFNIRTPAEIMQPSTQNEHVKAYGHWITPIAIDSYDQAEEDKKLMRKLVETKPGGKQ